MAQRKLGLIFIITPPGLFLFSLTAFASLQFIGQKFVQSQAGADMLRLILLLINLIGIVSILTLFILFPIGIYLFTTSDNVPRPPAKK